MVARGTTSEEVERALGMRHQTVSARRTDLRASGYTDYLRDEKGIRIQRSTSSKSPAYVQIVTEKGKNVIDNKLPLQLRGRDPTSSHHGDNPMSAQAFGYTSRYTDCYRILEHMRQFS